MRRALGRWLAETRSGRTVFLAVTILGVLGAAYMVIRGEVGRQTEEITERVTVIEEVSPYDVVLRCLRSPRCRQLFEHPRRALRMVPPDASGQVGDDAHRPSRGKQRVEPLGGDVGDAGEDRKQDGRDPDPDPGKEGSDDPSAPDLGGSGGPRPAASPPAQAPSATPAPDPPPSPEPNRPGWVESVTGPVSEVVEQVGKDVEGTVEKATCNPVVSLCP